MPAKSKKQQEFFGVLYAYKKGELPASQVSAYGRKVAKKMSLAQIKEMASTKRKNLPPRVSKKQPLKDKEIEVWTTFVDYEMSAIPNKYTVYSNLKFKGRGIESLGKSSNKRGGTFHYIFTKKAFENLKKEHKVHYLRSGTEY